VKVLVTGGAGYVGAALVARLACRDDIDEVVVYDNLARGNRNLFLPGGLPEGARGVRLARADLLDSHRLGRELDGVHTVFHLAARVTTPFADDDVHGFDQVNRWGTAGLAMLLERDHPSVQRLVHVSSDSVYGDTPDVTTPDAPPAPVTAYGASKLGAERQLERLEDRLDLCRVRCANVYGYGVAMRFDALINRLLFEAWFDGRMTLHGAGEARRSFVHVDAAARVLEAIGRGDHGDGVFHLVERRHSVLDVARAVGELVPEVETLFISQHLRRPDSLLDDDPRVPSELLETRPLVEVLRDTAAHFHSD